LSSTAFDHYEQRAEAAGQPMPPLTVRTDRRPNMPKVPSPTEGLVVTHFLVVADQDRSRDWYTRVLGAEVARPRDPVYLQLANSWIILNDGGGPTDDKPDVTLETPAHPDRVSAFLNLRVADIASTVDEWSQRGAEFLTEPVDHGQEIRAYMRDPDGHLIEVGQTTGLAD
jgi:lactoylglutathione lyase